MRAPLTVGDPVCGDLEVLRVTADRGRWTLVVGDAVTVHVEPPREDCAYLAESGGLGIWVEGPVDDRARDVVDAIALKLADRITEPPPPSPSAGTVFLVPGHLGNPLDISVRALHTLQTVARVFVEPGKEARTRALCTTVGIAAPEVSPLDADRIRALVAAGEDVAIFGVDEGIPGFVDPALPLSDLKIRSIGGPSVLGTVLMRLPELGGRGDWAFTFLGTLHDRGDQLRIGPHLRSPPLPVILFSHGAGIRLLADGPERDVHLLIALTRPDEQRITATTHTLPTLDDTVPVVVVLG